MLNKINNRGLSKSKKFKVLTYPTGTSSDIVGKINDVLADKMELLIVHVGTNDLANDINLLMDIKNIVTKTKKRSPNTVSSFSNIIIRKDKKNSRNYTKCRLKSYYFQKNLSLINNDSLKENRLVIKKLNLKRKGNGVFSNNLLNLLWVIEVSIMNEIYFVKKVLCLMVILFCIQMSKRFLRIFVSVVLTN